jgi:putative hydrolase of the HAD superfamily
MLAVPMSPITTRLAVRAIYFDLDDTLCGYWDASKAGLRTTFEGHPVNGLSVDEMTRHWAEAFRAFCTTLKAEGWYERYLSNGEPTRTECMRLALLRMGVDDPALARKMGDAYANARNANLTLFEGSLEALEELSERYPLGLITNGPADIQRQEIATLGIERFFKNIWIEGEMREGKPLESVFRRAQSAVNLPEQEILFVGNSYHHDIAPASRFGWKTLWVRRATDVAPSANKDAKPEERPTNGPAPDGEIHGPLNVLEYVNL